MFLRGFHGTGFTKAGASITIVRQPTSPPPPPPTTPPTDLPGASLSLCLVLSEIAALLFSRWLTLCSPLLVCSFRHKYHQVQVIRNMEMFGCCFGCIFGCPFYINLWRAFLLKLSCQSAIMTWNFIGRPKNTLPCEKSFCRNRLRRKSCEGQWKDGSTTNMSTCERTQYPVNNVCAVFTCPWKWRNLMTRNMFISGHVYLEFKLSHIISVDHGLLTSDFRFSTVLHPDITKPKKL